MIKTRRALLLAALWLNAASHAAIPAQERDALLAIFLSTNGSSWTASSGWQGAAGSECQWLGVRCTSGDTNVEGIFLGENNLTGTLPPQVGVFSRLTAFELHGNRIGGTLPSQIGSLAALNRLSFFSNRFSGSIPRELGNLTNLTYLALGDNQLDGAIPPELGNLVNVEFFSINGNRLDGPIPPELGRLRSARVVDLAYNEIGGTIPRELGNLSNTEELYLNNNRLTGPIPAELGNLAGLQILTASLNQLSGTIPRELGRLQALQVLRLGVNALSGPIPPELGSLARLEQLGLHQNQLDGAIPPELGNLSMLQELELAANRLSGPIPVALTRLAALQRLQLDDNRLTGTIPPEISRMRELRHLSFSLNQVDGTIPREITTLDKLISLSFYSNRISGPLPSDIGALTNLHELVVFENQLTGSIPDSIGNLTQMRQLLLGGNLMTGPIPPSITNLTALTFLDLRGNSFSGPIPADLDRLTQLDNLSLPGNRLTGPLPSSVSRLRTLTTLRVDDNDLTGTIPDLADLTNLKFLGLRNNHFEGTIPSALGRLTTLETLWLGGNKLQGPIPTELGQLNNLRWIDLGNNILSGAVPSSLTNLTSLQDNLSDFRYNLLFTNDATVRSFLNQKQDGGEWEGTQTLPPSTVAVTSLTDRSAIVNWSLARYTDDEGGYEVTFTAPGAPTVVATTSSKLLPTILVRGLRASTSYSVMVRTTTHPHGLQQNTLTSDPTASVSATTTAAVVAPAAIELTATTSGLLQSGGTPQNEDSFTLSNVGDVATAITFDRTGDFFEFSPTSFTLAGNASQTVTIRSLSRPPGSYSGELLPRGTGVPAGMSIPIHLLSVAPPTGTAVAEAAITRIDLAGERTTDGSGTIRFTNRGTGTLSGIVVADAPWLEPPRDIITIAPGASADVTFRVVRSKRPAAEGALAASLRLMYLDGIVGPGALGASTPGVSVTTVTVVDTARAPTSSSGIPSLAANEIARFIPGIVNQSTASGRVISDVFVSNSFGVTAVRDLRLYFADARATTSPSVATFAPVAPSQSLQLASVVSSVYGSAAQVGSLQLRTNDWDKLLINASTTDLRGDGQVGGAIPVFRSDRAAAATETIILPGVEKSTTRRTDLFIQETTGNPATAAIEVVNAAGETVGATRTVDLAAHAVSEISDAVPAGGATALVRIGGSGRAVAYAMVHDLSSNDRWAVTDWARFYRFGMNEGVRVNYLAAAAGAPSRRRPTGRTNGGTGGAAMTPTKSDITIFNPDSTPSLAEIVIHDGRGGRSSRDVSIPPRQTVMLNDVAGAVGRTGGYASVTPARGRIAVSSRSYSVGPAGTLGSSVAVTSASSGLRRGQSQVFAGIEAASPVSVADQKPGTFRTALGIVEAAGRDVRVRGTIQYHDGRSVVATTLSRTWDVSANASLVVGDVATAILGPLRPSNTDLHNLQITFDVVDGAGAAAIFLITTENATGDTSVRLE